MSLWRCLTCSLTVAHSCLVTALHSCSLTVVHSCSREVEHCLLFTVAHSCSCTVWHWGALRLRALAIRDEIRGSSSDTTEAVTEATEEPEELELSRLDEMAEVVPYLEVREARISWILGPISDKTSPTTFCSLICGAARVAAATNKSRRSLGEAIVATARTKDQLSSPENTWCFIPAAIAVVMLVGHR